MHRDFKPSNVLITARGRARVGDFGLARDAGDERFAVGSERVSGTPGYMAPEQRAGEPVDARADQYAFAVSLQDALAARRVIGAPPRRVRLAITRALAIDPSGRFPTMHELLAELSRALGSRRRIAVAALVAIAGIAGAASAALALRGPSDTCEADAHVVDDVWNPARGAMVAERFAAARHDAATTIATTARVIDEWTSAWRLDRVVACHAEPSVRAARDACLDSGLGELRAQVAVWTRADAETVDHAVAAAAALPPPAGCDGRTTSEVLSDSARAVVEHADAVKAAFRAGHAAQVRAELPALEAEASGSEHARAAALLAIAMVEDTMGDVAVAHDRFARAGVDAGRAGDDLMLFDAIYDESVTSTELGHPLETLGLIDAAEAVAARAKLDQTWQLATARGNAFVELGRVPDSYRELQRAVTSVEARAAGDSVADLELGTALALLATAHSQAHDFPAARPLLERSVAIHERELGAMHPETGKALGDLAEDEANVDDLADATVHAERARAIFSAAYGPDHPLVAGTDLTLAGIANRGNHVEEALAMFERARASLVTTLPPDNRDFLTIETSVAAIEANRNHYEASLVHFERAIALFERRGTVSATYGGILLTYAQCLSQLGRSAESYAAASKAAAMLEQTGQGSRELAEAWVTLADLESNKGHRARAIELDRKMLDATTTLDAPDVPEMRAHAQAQLVKWSK